MIFVTKSALAHEHLLSVFEKHISRIFKNMKLNMHIYTNIPKI
jgi:hypothetical protein